MNALLTVRRNEPASKTLETILAVLLVVVTVAGLYFAREVLIPIALAILLAFVLAPLVHLLRKMRVPRIAAVLIATFLSLAAVLGLGTVIGVQLASLASDLPRYAGTIEAKAERLSRATTGRLTTALQRVGPALAKVAAPDRPATNPTPKADRPLPVEVRQPPLTGFEIARRLVGALLGPLGTTAIVFVVAVFILLQQADLRDRLIRLAGAGDVHRATQAIDDAASRLSRYFLSQVTVNAAFGVVVGLGLYFIGLPHTVVWAALAGLMRFVPFFGGLVSAALPIALASAAEPGWSMALWTLALFVASETFTGQVVEPFLYGQSTGLSPVSVVVAAIFWSWLWGPIGLLLSTPLSMCLLVLGRHVPRLAVIEVLLGDRPALSPEQSLYQRLLAGDAEEAVEHAELILQGKPLSSYYDEVAMPALRAAAADVRQGVLRGDRLRKLRDAFSEVVVLLDLHPDEPEPAPPDGKLAGLVPAARPLSDAAPSSLPAGGAEPLVICVAAHGALDEAACAPLAQLLGKHGFRSRTERAELISRSAEADIDWARVDAVCISCFPPEEKHTRLGYVLAAVRRRAPGLPIVVCCWERGEAIAATLFGDHLEPSPTVGTLRDAIDECVRMFPAAEPAVRAQGSVGVEASG